MNATCRSMLLFEEGIKSKYTRQNYASHMRRFERFSGLDHDKILMTPREDLQQILEDYLIRLKQTCNPNAIPSMFQGIRHFCVMNRIHLDWEIIRKMFPQRQKMPTLRAYTPNEIQSMLDHADSPRNFALIHFLASTGARIGVFDHKMTLNHIKKMPNKCTAVRLYAGEVEEYWAFLTPQASDALDAYHKHRQRSGESLYNDSPIFSTTGSAPRQLGWNGARSALYRIISKIMTRHKQGRRYDVQAGHGFRKRFNTILKLDSSVNHNIAEKLMGHKNGLDGVYLTPTLEEMFTEFKKAIPKIEIHMDKTDCYEDKQQLPEINSRAC